MSTSKYRPPAPDDKPVSVDELDYLLSSGRLGGSQLERIMAVITESVSAREARRAAARGRPTMRIAAASAVVATAVASFLLWTRASVEVDHFRTKGDLASPALSIDAACLHASLRSCPRGSILAFSAQGASSGTFVTAYLDPLKPGARVWLLSDEPALATDSGVLARGARIPEDQEPGEYRIQVLVTRARLSRQIPADPASLELVGKARWEATVVP